VSILEFAQADVVCMISLLRAYLDEFDDYSNEECVCFGIQGLIGPVRAWHHVQCQWEDVLECNGISAYHATDLNAREGSFKGWSNYQKERLTAQLVGVIKANAEQFRLLGSGVVMSSFNYLPEYRCRHLRNPYFTAALSVMLDATRFSHSEYRDKPIEFVFDQKAKHKQWIDSAYEGVLATKWGNLCAAKSMADHRLVSPLQVADLVAYEAEKYIAGRFRDPSAMDLPVNELRWPIKQLRGLFMASDTTLHTWHSLMLLTDFWGNYKRLCRARGTKIGEKSGERQRRIQELRQHYAEAR
jgi:hypothetical protein